MPTARGQGTERISLGRGYGHRLVWAIRPAFDKEDELGRYEALVDAHSGELISFEDTNDYAASFRQVIGGVQPASNDGNVPDGVEQAGWPMPFDIVNGWTTDSGGNLPVPIDGPITSTLSGQYLQINDVCGPIALTSTGDIDFGTSVGTDCDTPGFGGDGNTHASRTAFHELNRIMAMARGQLPGNAWLHQQLIAQPLTVNVNNVGSCNANHTATTLNFFRSGGGCSNTGELAGVVDHEWGHLMDLNDAVPSTSSSLAKVSATSTWR